jgi:RNA polymerase sigma-70 factor (ECF subfamily)
MVDRQQDLALLRSAILSLPLKYREAVVLCDLEELDYETAARRIGCAVGTVRSRLHRARAILGAKLRRRDGCPA